MSLDAAAKTYLAVQAVIQQKICSMEMAMPKFRRKYALDASAYAHAAIAAY